MWKTISKFIPTLVTILFWVGLQMSGIVIPWLGYLLMGLAVLLLLIPGWSLVKRILSNIRRLRLILEPMQGHKDVSARFSLKLPTRQEQLLDFYEGQKANWKSYIRLELIRVMPKVTGNSPKITFQLEARNYLPVKFKLVKVTHTSGNISAGELGSCDLPALPETIDEEVNPCGEKQFTIDLAVHGTNVPKFLQSVSAAGQLLQWTLRGEWYVEIYDQTEVWQYQSYEIRHDQVIVASQVISRRGM